MNIYLTVILTIIIGEYLLNLVVEVLNIKSTQPQIPSEFEEYFDKARYKLAQGYLKANTKFTLLHEGFFTFILVMFILCEGFNAVDIFVRRLNLNIILTGLCFAGIIMLGVKFINLPFQMYKTFVIEARYGFNRLTFTTFFADVIKEILLLMIIGGLLFAGVQWFFLRVGRLAWLFSWIGVSSVQVFFVFIAPVVIFPLFNKFTPLPAGTLREEIESYATTQNFSIKGIFTMDASRRSAKSNAFFTGFGKNRRIVLFDTLISNHTVEEIVSILAHEIGHYKKKHIAKHMVFPLINTGIMFFILSLFIHNPQLFSAFKMEHISIYAGLFFFGFLYTPINFFFSTIGNILSRKYEFEADTFSVVTYRHPEAFITALKKLAKDNLVNLTPHPLKVFFFYSHPPLLARIYGIRNVSLSLKEKR